MARYREQMTIALERIDQGLARVHSMIKRGKNAEAIHFMEENQHSSDMVAFRDYEIAKLKRTYQVMQQGITDRNKQLANFWKFFASHDVRRDTSIIETFPEYADFFKECRNA